MSLATQAGMMRGAAAPGGGFDPLDLSPVLWLDGSDETTMFDATTGGSLVAVDAAIARWEDKSGEGNHATQTTGGNQPLRKAAVENGNDVVRFDGSGDRLGFPRPSGGVDSTWFIVSKTADVKYLTMVDSTNQGFFDVTENSGSAASAGSLSPVYRVNGASVADQRSALLTARGSGVNILTCTGISFTTSTANMMGFGGFDALIDMLEIFAVVGTLGVSDIEDMEGYLDTKWSAISIL